MHFSDINFKSVIIERFLHISVGFESESRQNLTPLYIYGFLNGALTTSCYHKIIHLYFFRLKDITLFYELRDHITYKI